MSIAVLVNVHDGVVLAADSAATLTLRSTTDAKESHNVYDNANKIANLVKGLPIGCLTYGSGSIGNVSISTLLKDLRKQMSESGDLYLDPSSYTVEEASTKLRCFLMSSIEKLGSEEPKPSLGLMIAGYSAGRSLSEAWILRIENGVGAHPVRLRKEGEVGISWGGAHESLARLVLGFSPQLPALLASVMAPSPTNEQLEQLVAVFRERLQAPLAFAPMPVQDAIDLAEWLVHTAEMFSRFTPGPRHVGGPIESAAITKHEGFKWIRRKHYFDERLNPKE